MVILQSIALVAALETAPIPAKCRVIEVEAFTGSAELPDGQIFGRVTRTVVGQRSYSPFARLEKGATWVSPEMGDKRRRPAIRISYDFWWDDSSMNSDIGPQRGDLLLLRVQNNSVVANPVICPKSTG